MLELLMVIAIMGIVAAIALPALRSMKPNAKVSATRQLLDAVSRARQLAMSQRTTVYMVFVPDSFWTAPGWNGNDWTAATNLFDKQLTGYTYVSLRSVGEQPGVQHPRYLDTWRTLPQGAYIPPAKFWTGFTIPSTTLGNNLWIAPFSFTNTIPFPTETNLPVKLPYIAFDGMGRRLSGVDGQAELIPITEGSVTYARDPNTKVAQAQAPFPLEKPPGNTTENYSLVYIDCLTGRAHVERRTAQ